MKNRFSLATLLLSVFLPSWAQIGGSYNPESPSDPGTPVQKYTLTLVAAPDKSGSFNITNERLAVGSTNSLRAYANSDFVFKCWMLGDKVLSTDPTYEFVMPNHSVKIVGQFEYNPESPSNPNQNYWNKLTGVVIVDDFKPGYLSTAISNVISGSNRSDVQMITVAGRMSSSDFGITNNYSNCLLLDLSRVAGITEIPSYAFDYTNLETVNLPSSIEKIGARAFAECKQLMSISLYAMTPPKLENNVFAGVPEELVIYVPVGAIERYKESEEWNKFTILPNQEDIRSISVSLPNGTNTGKYAQMWLELTNTKSGQRMHYIMTDRTTYTFANIIKNTSWNVVLRNERGDVFGKIDNIEVKDEDVNVSFTSLAKPQSVSLKVQTPDGKDVTDQVQITWTDANGNYMAQGTSLSALPAGYQLSYSLALSQDLAMQYSSAQPAVYTLKDGNNNLTCKLEAIKQVQITGKVRDATTGMALNGVVISASQTFGGKYSKSENGKTDAKGVFTMTVAKVPTSLAFASRDYISQTVTLDKALNEINDLGDIALDPISGATITFGFNYTTVDGETQNWYSDYENVGYTLYNKTRKQAINDFSVQYPQIVLLEEVSEGDVLELTAESKTQTFMPVKATAIISADQTAEATFNIVELGQLQVEYAQSGNVNVVASLYDSSGKLLKTYDYRNMSLTVSNLPDGNYTLVSMGSSQFFNSVYDLAQLSQTGLKAGTDYVQNAISMKSGEVTTVNIDLVPKLDESKFYYTGDNTSFTANKQSIVVGNYLTLTGHIDFKQNYVSEVSNVQMVIDLPKSCEFVENSVMVGNSTGSYTLNGHQLTIPLVRYTDRVRFCVIPTAGGEYAPSAFAKFVLNGKTITQPIGSANCTAKDLSITVASTVSTKEISVSGMATRQSSVEIYDNGILVGQTEASQNGSWQTTCTLNDAFNLSEHSIHAIIHRKDGVALKTETRNVTYDKDAIVPKTVLMTFYNAYLGRNVDVLFNIQNGTSSVTSYSFNKKTPFTFIADLSNNSSETINSVHIHVYTSDDKVTTLQANYDADLQRWVAVQEFTSKSLPVSVSVTVDANSPLAFDEEYYTQQVDDILEDLRENDSQKMTLEEAYTELESELSMESFDGKYVKAIIERIVSLENELLGINDDLTDLEFKQRVDAVTTEEELMDIINGLSFGEGDTYELPQGAELVIPSVKLSDGTMTPVMKFITNSDLPKSEDLTSWYAECLSMFFDESFSTAQFSISKDGVITCEKSTGEKFIIDFTGIIAYPSDEINTATSRLTFLDSVASYIEQMFHEVDIAQMLAIQQRSELLAMVSRYHYALEAIPRFGQPANIRAFGATQQNIFFSRTRGIGIIDKIKSTNFYQGIRFGIKAPLAILNLQSFYEEWNEASKDANDWTKTIDDISQACFHKDPPEDFFKRKEMLENMRNNRLGEARTLIAIRGVVNIVSKVAICFIPGPITYALGWAFSNACNIGMSWYIDKRHQDNQRLIKEMRKQAKEECCKNNSDCLPDPEPKPIPDPSPIPPVEPILDPSGYVYEAVASNRLQGVTATVFQKVEEEDMYGDVHDVIVKWDAEAFGQINPEITDHEGNYAWDVPQGLWQVKFEKEGYETTYSEWLPVPPPQLDINIAMTQNRQPEVKSARAFKDAVELEFDKYMQPELLTTENIIIMVGNKAVEGTVELLNEEMTYEGENKTFASKVRFNAVKPFEGTEVTLMVSNRVKSYAGIRMQDDFSQQFTIEEEIKQIVSKQEISVGYGMVSEINVSVLPVSASAGKKLNVVSSSSMILGVKTEQIVIDKDGKAKISVVGKLPGSTAISLSIENSDKTTNIITKVKQKNDNTIIGDANGDGEVDEKDVSAIDSYIMGKTPENFDEDAADLNGDTKVNVADIVELINLLEKQ